MEENKKKRLWGMKRKKKTPRKNAKTKLSNQQKERNARMRKVKEGESLKAWENRVRGKKLLSEEQIERFLKTKKVSIWSRKENKVKRAKQIKEANRLEVEVFERHFNFMKYSGVVINFYTTKFGISRLDLEVLFLLNDNAVFNVDRFNNACILIANTSNGYFKRFKAEGYITPIQGYRTDAKGIKTEYTTNLFKVSRKCNRLISDIYVYLAKLNKFKTKQPELKLCPKETLVFLEEMNREIEAYLVGDKKQQSIQDIKDE